jgi:hypothetical protein
MSRRAALCVVAAALAMVLAAVSAPALIGRWYTDKTAAFSGAVCGSTSTVTVSLPRNAFAVTAQTPQVGTAMKDLYTGLTVARITSIDDVNDGRHRLIYTATGSDDVCANPSAYSVGGWMTDDVYFRVEYSTREHVLYPTAFNDPTYRPRRIGITPMGWQFYVEHIHWRWWRDSSARGVGVGHTNDCVPYCAAGHFHSYSGVVIRLERPRFCATHSDYEFTRLRFRFTRGVPSGAPRDGNGIPGCALP